MRASYREKGILVKKLINYKGVIISVRRDLPHDLFAANGFIQAILFQLISITFTIEPDIVLESVVGDTSILVHLGFWTKIRSPFEYLQCYWTQEKLTDSFHVGQ